MQRHSGKSSLVRRYQHLQPFPARSSTNFPGPGQSQSHHACNRQRSHRAMQGCMASLCPRLSPTSARPSSLVCTRALFGARSCQESTSRLGSRDLDARGLLTFRSLLRSCRAIRRCYQADPSGQLSLTEKKNLPLLSNSTLANSMPYSRSASYTGPIPS